MNNSDPLSMEKLIKFSTKVRNLSEMNPCSDKMKAISDNSSRTERGLIIPSSKSTFSMADSDTIKNSSNSFLYNCSLI